MTNIEVREGEVKTNTQEVTPKRWKLPKILAPLTLMASLMVAGAMSANASTNSNGSEQPTAEPTPPSTPTALATSELPEIPPSPRFSLFLPIVLNNAKIQYPEATLTPLPTDTLPPPSATVTSEPTATPTETKEPKEQFILRADTRVYPDTPDIIFDNFNLESIISSGNFTASYDNATYFSLRHQPLSHRVTLSDSLSYWLEPGAINPNSTIPYGGVFAPFRHTIFSEENQQESNEMIIDFNKNNSTWWQSLPGSIRYVGYPGERTIRVTSIFSPIEAIQANSANTTSPDAKNPINTIAGIMVNNLVDIPFLKGHVGFALYRGTVSEDKKNGQGIQIAIIEQNGLLKIANLLMKVVNNQMVEFEEPLTNISSDVDYNRPIELFLTADADRGSVYYYDREGEKKQFGFTLTYPVSASDEYVGIFLYGEGRKMKLRQLEAEISANPDSLVNLISQDPQVREEASRIARLRNNEGLVNYTDNAALPFISQFTTDYDLLIKLNAHRLDFSHALQDPVFGLYESYVHSTILAGEIRRIEDSLIQWARINNLPINWGLPFRGDPNLNAILRQDLVTYRDIVKRYWRQGDLIVTSGAISSTGNLSSYLVSRFGSQIRAIDYLRGLSGTDLAIELTGDLPLSSPGFTTNLNTVITGLRDGGVRTNNVFIGANHPRDEFNKVRQELEAQGIIISISDIAYYANPDYITPEEALYITNNSDGQFMIAPPRMTPEANTQYLLDVDRRSWRAVYITPYYENLITYGRNNLRR